jgi:hypothetical protein
MRDHLRKIKQNVAKRAAAFATYKATVDELDKQDAESLMGLKGAGVSNASCAGYIGAASKAIINSKTLHDGMGKATESHCSVMGKVADGIAGQLHIDIQDRSNANADEAAGANPTHNGENMEGTPVEHGLKGVKAADLHKLSMTVPGKDNALLKCQIKQVLGVGRNANCTADPFGFAKSARVDPVQHGGQPRVLSTYEQRKLDEASKR